MDSMDPPVIIKDELVIEEEELIKVKTENSEIEHDNLPAETFNNIILDIKLENNDNENCYVENEVSSIDKPNCTRITVELNTDLKKENNETIVSYDEPNFDECGSIDSHEAIALENVEACLQDESDIKTENEVLEETQKEDFQSTEVKIETLITDQGPATEITPDLPSFVMKIPSDVMNDIDNMASSHTENCTTEYHTTYPEEENIDNDTDTEMNTELFNNVSEQNSLLEESGKSTVLNHTFNNVSEQNSLLEESGKSTELELNPFQLNSITGNVLSLEQEAYNMLKSYHCHKCIKSFTAKALLLKHLKVHESIDRYTNGRKRGVETRKRNAMQKKKLIQQDLQDGQNTSGKKRKKNFVQQIKQEIDLDSQDSCHNLDKQKEPNYKCTCGKPYQRKTRMLACLRTHDCCKSEKFFCVTCLKEFGSKDELALHRKRLHRKKFPCKFCPTDYATRKKLFKHLQLHQKVHQTEYKVIEEIVKRNKKLRCFLCSLCFSGISELKIHVLTEHKGPYLCPHCKNTFPKIVDFGNHTKTYHPEVKGQSVMDVLEAFSRLTQEWKCEECDLQFLEADKLAMHQVEQHSPELKIDQQQFQCPDCRRVFISQKGLTSHRRIHHSVETSEQAKVEETGILCLECRKICKDMTALTSHMRFHSSDRKYPCKFCDFRFATPEKRKVHSEVHTGDMKFVCFICEYQCSSENRLKKHKQSLKHANMREYLLTGKPLIEESSSKDKNKKEGSPKKKQKCKEIDNNDPISDNSQATCDVCGENFSSESEMLEHKQTHPFIEFPNEDTPSRIFFK